MPLISGGARGVHGLALASAVAVAICASPIGPAFAGDDGQAPIWSGLGGLFGLSHDDNDVHIDYRERGRLVLPPKMTLPPPAPPAAPGTSPAAPASPLPAWLKGPKLWGAAAGALILVLTLAVVGIRRLRGKPARRAAEVRTALPAGAKAAPGLPAGESVEEKMEAKLAGQAQSQARLEAEALEAMRVPTVGTSKADVLTKYLRESLKKDPQCQVQTLRTWLNEKG